MRTSYKITILLAVIASSLGFIQTGHAECSFKVVVKYSVADTRLDSLGNEFLDSLAEFLPIGVTVFRSPTDYLRQADTTNDSGYVVVSFDTWAGGAPVVAESIVREQCGDTSHILYAQVVFLRPTFWGCSILPSLSPSSLMKVRLPRGRPV